MKSYVEEIKQIMPLPKAPVWNRGDWAAVEGQMKIRFPADFKEFIEAYGSGEVSGYLNIVSPFEKTPGQSEMTFTQFVNDMNYQINALAEDGMFEKPALFPEPDGLLTFGTSMDHHETFWRTKGEPDAWYIVVFATNSFEFHALEGTSMSKFIFDLVNHAGPLAKKGILLPENFARREFVPSS